MPPTPKPRPKDRNALSFDQKLDLVLCLDEIRDAGIPVKMDEIRSRLSSRGPEAAAFLDGRGNLERLMEAAKFPEDLVASDKPLRADPAVLSSLASLAVTHADQVGGDLPARMAEACSLPLSFVSHGPSTTSIEALPT